MALLVVSDLHIRGSDDPLYASLLRLLGKIAAPGDDLVLAGDVFDLFVGNKSLFRNRYSAFFDTLRSAASRGVKLSYIEGNHDFLMTEALGGLLRLDAEKILLEIDGKRFYVAHGDTVDRRDLGYRALRAFFRSPAMRGIVMATPGEWLDAFGKKSSQYSGKSRPRLPSELPPVRLDKMRALYRSFAAKRIREGFDFVVMGHCHDLDSKEIRVGGRDGQYINVGYPRVHGTYLRWQPGDRLISRVPLP